MRLCQACKKNQVAKRLIQTNYPNNSMNSDNKNCNNQPIVVNNKKPYKKKLGFTNRLAVCLVLFLAVGLAGGFILALLSIKYNYTGPLMCWTIVFTPIGTAISIVLGKIVDKSKAENTGGNGDGINYAIAAASGFCNTQSYSGSVNSPGI